jgi:ABC-type dipeptide/oligopeptide/nickel transport system permease subunit
MITEDSALAPKTPTLTGMLQEFVSESTSRPWHPWLPAAAIVLYNFVSS